MSDRFNSDSPLNHADGSPAQTVCHAIHPMSPNVPQCPTKTKFSPNSQNEETAVTQNNPVIYINSQAPQDPLDPANPGTSPQNDQSPIDPADENVPDYQPIPEQPDAQTEDLTVRQKQAIVLLLQGHSDKAVAQRLGITRKTIYRWKWYHANFNSALIEAQREFYAEAKGLLKAATLTSARKLNHIVKKGQHLDAIRAAKLILSPKLLERLDD